MVATLITGPGGTVTALQGAEALAASDAAFQGTEMLVGNQSQFNWTELAASAIAGGISGGAGFLNAASGWQDAAVKAVESNTVRQGVNLALGQQKTFDWAGVAVAGITGAVAYEIQTWGNTVPKGAKAPNMNPATAVVLSGVASDLAGAAAKSLLTGEDFGKSVRDVLPDAIGATIGNLIAGAMHRDVANMSYVQ